MPRPYLIKARNKTVCTFYSLHANSKGQATRMFYRFADRNNWEFEEVEAYTINSNRNGVRQVTSLKSLKIVDNRSIEQIRADGDERWPDGLP